MPELDRIIEYSTFAELGFVEREAIPKFAMKLSIQLYLAGLSLTSLLIQFQRVATRL